MEAQTVTVVTQIMASYIKTKNEMEQTFNKRINDLITQKQICNYQINNLYHQQLQKAIDTIQNITTKNTNTFNQEQAHDQLNNVQIENIVKDDSNILSSKNKREKINDVNKVVNICSYCRKQFIKRSLLKRHVEVAHIEDIEINNNAINIEIKNTATNRRKKMTDYISNDRLKNHLQKKHQNKLKKKQSAHSSRRKVKNKNSDSDYEPPELSESCSPTKYRSTTRIRTRSSNLDSDDNDDDSDDNDDDSDLSDKELEKLKKQIDEMDKNDLKCPICHKIGRDKYNLKYHLIVHTKKKPFKCCWCKKRYKRDCSLKLHKKESCEFRYLTATIANHNKNNSQNKKRKKILKKKSSKKIHSAGKRRRNPKHDEFDEIPPLKKGKKSKGITGKIFNKNVVSKIEEDYVSVNDTDGR
eukprot:115139_1